MPEFRRDRQTGRFNRRDSPRDSSRDRSGSGSFGRRDSGSSGTGFRGRDSGSSRDSPRSGGFGARSSERSGGFGERRTFSGPSGSGKSNFGSRNFQDRDEPKFFGKRTTNKQDLFKVICAKCGVECEVPFKPTSNKPIFCSSCFKKSDGYESRDFDKKKEAVKVIDNSEKFDELSQKIDELSERFDGLDEKITKIMNLLGINEK